MNNPRPAVDKRYSVDNMYIVQNDDIERFWFLKTLDPGDRGYYLELILNYFMLQP